MRRKRLWVMGMTGVALAVLISWNSERSAAG
jgi:uncharacterized membrane protein